MRVNQYNEENVCECLVKRIFSALGPKVKKENSNLKSEDPTNCEGAESAGFSGIQTFNPALRIGIPNQDPWFPVLEHWKNMQARITRFL